MHPVLQLMCCSQSHRHVEVTSIGCNSVSPRVAGHSATQDEQQQAGVPLAGRAAVARGTYNTAIVT
jgi:hypothetical protein